MEKRIIITISRQYGSGGRVVGEQLAKMLDIPFYDKELIALAAKKSGFREDVFENADKQAISSLLYSLSTGMYSASAQLDGVDNLPLNDRVFLIQHNVLRDIAQKGSCVIVGRCANYVLKDDPDAINVFIHAPLSARVTRATEEYARREEHVDKVVQKMDKRRAAYYEYYTGMKWGQVQNYHLTLDSNAVGTKGAAEIIRAFAELHIKTK